MRNKILIIGLLFCLALGTTGVVREYGPTIASWVSVPVSEPVSMVVVIEETKHANKSRDVFFQATSNALRDAGKWGQYDKDQVPKQFSTLLEAATKEQTDPAKWQPWMFILHGTKVTWKGPAPTTEAQFAERVQQQGGI